MSAAGVEAGLLLGCALPNESGGHERQVQCARDFFGQRLGLIKAALSLPCSMEWHWHDCCVSGNQIGWHMRGQQCAKRPGAAPPTLIFEPMDRFAERTSEREANENAIKLWMLKRALCRVRLERCPAAFTEQRARPSAANAAFREKHRKK
jgi:hypothetical protein